MIKTIIYRSEDVRDFVERFFQKLNVSHDDAKIAADVLLSADLRGVDSHGIIRLNTYYGSRLRQGLIDPTSPVSVINETATTLALNGGNGLGQVVGYQAMQRCIEKARQSGVAMVTVRNSNHYGIAGYFAMMALPQDMIGISFTNSQPLVAPTYGRTPVPGYQSDCGGGASRAGAALCAGYGDQHRPDRARHGEPRRRDRDSRRLGY
jgi:L-2-hydroxycarboxylate dehydrogenase (NAD+)